MEFSLKYRTKAKCHPEDLWQVFSEIEKWHTWCDIFGTAGWVKGQPWRIGSRFFLELLYPQRIDLEVMVLKCDAPREIVLLPHGEGYAAQQWIHFRTDSYGETYIQSEEHFVGNECLNDPRVQENLRKMFDRWFQPLARECQARCKALAL